MGNSVVIAGGEEGIRGLKYNKGKERLYTMIKWYLYKGFKDGTIFANQ